MAFIILPQFYREPDPTKSIAVPSDCTVTFDNNGNPVVIEEKKENGKRDTATRN